MLYLTDGRLIDTTLHLDRLDRSLRELRITPPMTRAALLCVLGEVARRNRRRHGLLYMQITRGTAKREHRFPPAGTPPSLVVTLHRATAFPRDIEGWTASAITRPDDRWARCDIKTVSLLHQRARAPGSPGGRRAGGDPVRCRRHGDRRRFNLGVDRRCGGRFCAPGRSAMPFYRAVLVPR